MSKKKDEIKIDKETTSIDEQEVESEKISDEKITDVNNDNVDEKKEEISENLEKQVSDLKSMSSLYEQTSTLISRIISEDTNYEG